MRTRLRALGIGRPGFYGCQRMGKVHVSAISVEIDRGKVLGGRSTITHGPPATVLALSWMNCSKHGLSYHLIPWTVDAGCLDFAA
ncbi:MAG TPA: hypothetical protein VEI52_08070 [Terriglobales bacterium]|nr:hypothetical protein [Terriglobales bacterium]